MNHIPKPEKGLKRLYKALFYSFSGIKLAFRDEEAFRIEFVLFPIMTLAAIWLPLPLWVKSLLIILHVMLLIVELLNTAIEAVVDLVSPGFDLNAKKAKDTASAAVFFNLVMLSLFWLYALYSLI